MGPRAIRVLAVLSTLIVLAGGTLANRDLFLEAGYDHFRWPPEPVAIPGPEGGPLPVIPEAQAQPQHIVVDAGDGVRVHVEGQTGTAGVVMESRSWFAHAEVTSWNPGEVIARCLTPLPISRCAIWLSVTTAGPADTVTIRQHPGAIIGDLPPNVAVTVEHAG